MAILGGAPPAPARRAVRLGRKLRLAVGMAALAAGFAGAAARGEEGQLKAAVMATYLVKFAPFVEWPASSFAAADSPLTICVLDTTLGSLADQAAAGQKLGSHPIAVRHVAAAAGAAGCQLLFLDRASGRSGAAALNAVAGAPVLTVTDEPESAARKGIVNFVVVNNRVRFQIDNAAAARAGLRLSSQLLALAVNIGGQ